MSKTLFKGKFNLSEEDVNAGVQSGEWEEIVENGIHKIKYFEEIDEDTEKDINVLTAKKPKTRATRIWSFK